MTSYIEILKTLIRYPSFLNHLSLEDVIGMRSISNVIKKIIDGRLNVRREDNSVTITHGHRRLFRMNISVKSYSINPFLEPSKILECKNEVIEYDSSDITIDVRDDNNERSIIIDDRYYISYNFKKINDGRYSGTYSYHSIDYNIVTEEHRFMIDGTYVDVKCNDHSVLFYSTSEHRRCKTDMYHKVTKVINEDAYDTSLRILSILL